MSDQTLAASLVESQDVIKQAKTRTPLPRLQLFTIFLIQFAEPITATVIYPFVPQFIRNTGITNGDETKIGYYAGIIVRIAASERNYLRLTSHRRNPPFLLQSVSLFVTGHSHQTTSDVDPSCFSDLLA